MQLQVTFEAASTKQEPARGMCQQGKLASSDAGSLMQGRLISHRWRGSGGRNIVQAADPAASAMGNSRSGSPRLTLLPAYGVEYCCVAILLSMWRRLDGGLVFCEGAVLKKVES